MRRRRRYRHPNIAARPTSGEITSPRRREQSRQGGTREAEINREVKEERASAGMGQT
jgi:hypothetical protein